MRFISTKVFGPCSFKKIATPTNTKKPASKGMSIKRKHTPKRTKKNGNNFFIYIIFILFSK